MDFLIRMSKQPLFRLIAAILVLLLTDTHPVIGLGAAALWIVWVVWSNHVVPSSGSHHQKILFPQ
jgi:hypothetical protein